MRLLLSAAVIAGICLASVPGVVKAQGSLRLYTDPAFTQCTLSDTAPGVVSVHVVMTVGDADWVQFRVAASPGFTGVWMADASPFVLVGSSQTDLTVVFNNCKVGRFLIVTITYQLFGTSTCSELAIAPPVGFTEPIYDSCSFTFYPLFNNSPLHVNCSGSFDCNPVAVEPTTWGQVKALYGD
jgi:hypothetical protein